MPKVTIKKKKRAKKARGHGGDRRQEIIDAATKILMKEGYDALSMRRVAAEVGISSTALYLYFKEKDEILDTVCYAVFDRIVPQMEALLASPGEPVDRLRRGLTLYLRFGFDYPDQYRIVFLTPRDRRAWDHSDPLHFVDRWGQNRTNTYAYLIAGLTMAVEAGQIRKDDIMIMAQTVFAAMHGALAMVILSPDQSWAPTDVLIEETVNMIMRGLEPDRGR
jgi:AcrR family transcriptional regulator